MSIRVDEFGITKDGQRALLYTLSNASLTVKVTNFGAEIVSVLVRDSEGAVRDVLLGFDELEGYESDHPGFGSPIGRCANRIAGGECLIGGVKYEFERNQHGNLLHSGSHAWNKRMWEAQIMDDGDTPAVRMTLHSPDGDQGFPGSADVSITYSVTGDGGLRIDYSAVSDKTTLFNITNHSYFNLDESLNVLGHRVKLFSDAYIPTDDVQIPTGEIADVTGTPMDFREEKTLGRDIYADDHQLRLALGYDQTFVLNNDGRLALAAVCTGEKGIVMEVWTDMPGIQMYTGNNLRSAPGRKGRIHEAYSSVCFETQFYPDAVHHDNFKTPEFAPGEEMRSTTIYKFHN